MLEGTSLGTVCNEMNLLTEDVVSARSSLEEC